MQLSGLKRFFVSATLVLLSASPAFAEDSAAIPASLSFQYSGFKWTRTNSKFKGDTENTIKATSLLSGDLVDSFLYATIAGKVNLYFYPFQDANALVSVGYMLFDNLEVGVDLGLNATRVESPKNEVSSDLVGGFTTWTVAFSNISLENIMVLDVSRIRTSTFNSVTGEDDESRVTGSFMKVSSTVVIPIAKNAYYLGGVWLAADHSKNHTLDATKSSTQFGLMLAGLRISVE